ncbi:alpha/beta fold hydrolase [Prauserella endophytica]|nr:alpha/beta hydrolase [Prauserella endophytica]
MNAGTEVVPEYGSPEPPAGRGTPPAWFSAALRRERHTGEVDVGGVPIRFLAWGEPGSPATILVHGGAAHAMWWAPIAARLDPDSYVVALDLSGHGCSGHRPVYAVEHWAEEIAAVAEAVSPAPATVVAHSLGGIVTSCAMTRADLAGRFRRAVLVDAPVWPDAAAPEQPLADREIRPHRTYANAAEALGRFRLVPPQPCDNDWYVEHIAWHSLRPVAPSGWQWRFDPRIFANPTGDHRITRFEGSLDRAGCPFAVVMGERSYLAPGARAALADRPGTPLRFVPDAAHHVMLDQPLALLSQLRDLLGSWP